MSHHDHDHKHGHEHHHSHDHHDHRHDHEHEHHHSHHDHGEAHHQHHHTPGQLTERDKLEKIVEHWIHHNEEHARSYMDWAHRAHHMGESEVGKILEQIAAATQQQDEHFERILSLLRSARGA